MTPLAGNARGARRSLAHRIVERAERERSGAVALRVKTSQAPSMSLMAPPTNLMAPPTNLMAPPTNLMAPPMTLMAPPMTLMAPPMTLMAPPMTLMAPPTTLMAPPMTLMAPAMNLTARPMTLMARGTIDAPLGRHSMEVPADRHLSPGSQPAQRRRHERLEPLHDDVQHLPLPLDHPVRDEER